jgi:hypothetical protein
LWHIHVSYPEGEAKFWLRPTIELARNIGLNSSKIKDAERIVESRQQEITDAWNNHFGGLKPRMFPAIASGCLPSLLA